MYDGILCDYCTKISNKIKWKMQASIPKYPRRTCYAIAIAGTLIERQQRVKMDFQLKI